ncbi:MAG TPA: hypothetical protein PLU81_05460 [Deltaproteobacteria bacterium]|nr:hypothetical protein [Deltaproteobacteria bacterium]HPJ94057.1 hypothetical protein [Deltaproteobacteria bacterium]HPR51213.1 hypothetical protein [Deltaproteobacteria bacterium]
MKMQFLQSKQSLALIWLIFFIMRSVLGFIHIQTAKKHMKPIRFSFSEATAKKISASAQGELNRFIEEVNKYIDRYNKTSARQHVITALGYYAASLTALFSMFLVLRSIISKSTR